jgi:hypothetical protein
VHADKRQMLQDLTQSLQLRPTRAHVLWELASCICSAVGADGFRLYLSESGSGESEGLGLYLGQDCLDENGEPQLQKVKSGLTVPNYVARTREPVRLSKGDVDARFPEGIMQKVGLFRSLIFQNNLVNFVFFPERNLPHPVPGDSTTRRSIDSRARVVASRHRRTISRGGRGDWVQLFGVGWHCTTLCSSVLEHEQTTET